MGPGARASELAGIPTAKELTERALRRLLRGGTIEALAREMAWAAVRSTGANASSLDRLAEALELRLAEDVDRLQTLVQRAGASAKAEHLQRWASDLSGAQTAAVCAGQDEAEEALSRLYVDVLDWACDLLGKRCQKQRVSRGLRQLRPARPPAKVELPALVAEGLRRRHEPFGWPTRAGEAPASQLP
jgi:hypothetical protein